MPRWFTALCFGGSLVAAFACNDETVEVVDKTVCYSEMRWVGEKRGSPEMFPGRDCVGCHIDNDGPPLAIGGTIYPFVKGPNSAGYLAQTGTDCFGIEGVTVRIEDAEGLPLEVVTNRAGNFYVEGNPDDFAKPFTAAVIWKNADALPEDEPQTSPMLVTTPSYGGCARCHNPEAVAYTPPPELDVPDEVVIPQARIGLPGYGPGADGFVSVDAELEALGCQKDPTIRGCDRILNPD